MRVMSGLPSPFVSSASTRWPDSEQSSCCSASARAVSGDFAEDALAPPPQAAAQRGMTTAIASPIRCINGTFKRVSFIVSSPKGNRGLTIRGRDVRPQDGRKSYEFQPPHLDRSTVPACADSATDQALGLK